MVNKHLIDYVKAAIKAEPAVHPHLFGRARWISAVYMHNAVKTEEALTRQVYNRCKELYNGEIDAGEFLDAMASIVEEQLTKAFREALRDNELDPELVKEDGEGYKDELEAMILNEFDYVDGLAADVLAAKDAGTGFEEFRARAELWGSRYNDAYNQANAIIAENEGNNLIWIYGDTEHCTTCNELNGIVARAADWETAGVYPQQPPNDLLECGGWRCQCRLEPTDKRRSPKALDTILNVIAGGGL